MSARPTLHLVLYGKPGCHLCEQAETDLVRLRRRYPHALQVVDITQDPELLARYGLRIPVLVVAGHEYDAPLEAVAIARVLEAVERAPDLERASGVEAAGAQDIQPATAFERAPDGARVPDLESAADLQRTPARKRSPGGQAGSGVGPSEPSSEFLPMESSPRGD